MKQGWEYTTFADIMKPAKSERCGNRTDLPILSITMRQGIIFQNERFKKVIASQDTKDYKIIKEGQLVIAFPIDEGLIYTQNIAKEGIMSPAYNVWNVDYSKLNKKFLNIYFHSPWAMKYYKSKLRGTTLRRRMIPKEDLLAMPIPVPPITEQENIVAELDCLSGIIEKKKQQLTEYDALAQSIFYEMFGNPIDNEKGWEVKKLGEVCKTTSGGTPPKGRDEYYNGGNIPWLRSGEVDKMNITETELFITDLGLQNSSAKWFPENTVVVAMYGATVGQVGILRRKMTTNQAICGIFPNEKFFPIYLYHFLLSKKQEYLKIATGGAQANISQNIIRDTDVCLPPIEKQQEFASKIEAIEKQKELIKQSIVETETLFNSRMDYYFN